MGKWKRSPNGTRAYKSYSAPRPGEDRIVVPGEEPAPFLDVPGYEGLYSVSTEGAVRSLTQPLTAYHARRKRKPRQGRELVQKRHRTGSMVKLSKDDTAVDWYVHQLVYAAFNNEELGHGRVRHMDGDIFNNALDNLRLDVKEKAPD